jgi:Leucine-rich repeat (LRR) protein
MSYRIRLALVVLSTTAFCSNVDAQQDSAVGTAPIATAPKARVRTVRGLDDPAFQKWMAEFDTMFPIYQAEEVAKKLQALNPGYDGAHTYTTKDGVIVSFEIKSPHIVDLLPIRALTELKSLTCTSNNYRDRGKLSDVSPLHGMKLTSLVISVTDVSDLSPLGGMPLESLDISTTNVAELSALKGMPLKKLKCFTTTVSDLSPLEGMPLEEFACGGQVSDISPLKGMPLKKFSASSSQLTDLSPLKGAPITEIRFQGFPGTDLSSLAGMPLATLDISMSKVADLSPLKGAPLKELRIWESEVASLEPLRGMPLNELTFNDTNVADLAPLRGMPLTYVSLSKTKVTDISPLTSCTSLYSAYLGDLNLKPEQIAELKQAVPRCNIRWDDPAAKKPVPQPSASGIKK